VPQVVLQSKGIGIKADGTVGSVVYEDIITRQPDGWKISYRKVTARRAALGDHELGPRMTRRTITPAGHLFAFPAEVVGSRMRRRISRWQAVGGYVIAARTPQAKSSVAKR
jgi:hypothetical protein